MDNILKRFRERAGLTQEMVAEQMGGCCHKCAKLGKNRKNPEGAIS